MELMEIMGTDRLLKLRKKNTSKILSQKQKMQRSSKSLKFVTGAK